MGLLREVAVTHATFLLTAEGKQGKVRGLSLTDIGNLMADHIKEVSQLFEGQIKIEEVATRWPLFTAKIIAIAMDEPDDWEFAQKLNATSQLDALMKIWDLTILDEEILGKVLSRVNNLLPLQADPAFEKSKSPTGKKISSKQQKS